MRAACDDVHFVTCGAPCAHPVVLHRFFPACRLRALQWWVGALLVVGASAALSSDHPASAHGDRVLAVATNSVSPTSLTAWFDVLEDPSRTLSFDDVRSSAQNARFTASGATGEALNYGITPSVWWLRLKVVIKSGARRIKIACTAKVCSATDCFLVRTMAFFTKLNVAVDFL